MKIIKNFFEWVVDAWFGIAVTIVISMFIGGLIWLVIADETGYREQCHNSGGHIIEVHGNDICVDREQRVIHL